jgi:hypothetical protein
VSHNFAVSKSSTPGIMNEIEPCLSIKQLTFFPVLKGVKMISYPLTIVPVPASINRIDFSKLLHPLALLFYEDSHLTTPYDFLLMLLSLIME